MLTKYPWFRLHRSNIEQSWDESTRTMTHRWLTPPGRLIAIDVRLLNDRCANPTVLSAPRKIERGAVFTLMGVSYIVLRLNERNGIEWYAVRKDAWTPILCRFDALMWRLFLAEIRIRYRLRIQRAAD